jgi:hypothetical protein
MKFDDETSTIEFTVHVPVGAVAAACEYVESTHAAVPVAALMHLLKNNVEQVSVPHIIAVIKDHVNFEDSLAAHGLFLAEELVPSE